MAGRINRRGWIVVESIASTDGGCCVDFFEDPAGGFGFAHFRTDAEDGGGWTTIGASNLRRFDSLEAAVGAAVDDVSWLREERRPQEALAAWRDWLNSSH